MTLLKIALAAGALAFASPMAAHASQDFKDCFYTDAGCPSQVAKEVTTYSLFGGSAQDGFDPFAKVSNQKIVKVLEASTTLYQGGHATN